MPDEVSHPPKLRPAAQPVASTPGLRASTPGQATSTQEMVNAVESVANGFRRAMDSVMDKFAQMQKDQDGKGEDVILSKFQIISGLQFKRDSPMIADTDTDCVLLSCIIALLQVPFGTVEEAALLRAWR